MAPSSDPAPRAEISAAEVEFWRSADRISTVESYRAYLDAYSNGHFAKLAKLAIARLQVEAPASVLATPVQIAGLSEQSLVNLSRPASSGAVSFRLGDSFHGAGPVTVGWFGAKKQLVVPEGTWIALSAVDHYSSHASSVQLTTVHMGQFRDNALQSMMVYTFNSKTGLASNWWSEHEACIKSNASFLGSWQSKIGPASQCAVFVENEVFQPSRNPGWNEVVGAMRSVGVSVPNTRKYQARVIHVDHYGGFLGVERTDFDLPADAAEARRTWTKRYAKESLAGFQQKIEFAELEPGIKKTATLSLAE